MTKILEMKNDPLLRTALFFIFDVPSVGSKHSRLALGKSLSTPSPHQNDGIAGTILAPADT